MKKLALLATLLLVMLGALALPAAAQDDAHPLAQYFPATAPLYLEFRTDDDFLLALDELVTQIGTLVPDANIDSSLMEMLDEGVSEMVAGGSFATTIRPWLGDEAAFGLYEISEDMSDDDQPFLLIVSVADQAAAEEFLDSNAPANFSRSEEDGYTLYTPDNNDSGEEPGVIFRDDVAIITNSEAIIEAGGLVDGSLSSSDGFNTAATMLPESEYGVFGYIDTPQIINASMGEQMMGSDEMAMFGSLFEMIQPQAFGLTQLGENGLVIDFASPISLAADSPFAMTATGPIDPVFAQHIPANSALVIHGTNLYQSYQGGMQSLNALAEMMAENPDFDAEDLEMAMFGLNFGVRGLTGLEIDEAIGWMTGDYAFAVALAPAFADASNVMGAMDALPVDFSFVVEATDADAAQALYDGLSESLSEFAADELEVTEETLDGGSDALVLTITSPEVPFPIEIVTATGNGVFAVGTRRMVEAALNPQNGLDGDAQFTAAAETVLEGANAVVYVGANALQPLARVMSDSSNPESTQEDGKMLKQILSLFSSLTISSAVEADNSGGVTRFVWTLPE